jgi:hypothetical protein
MKIFFLFGFILFQGCVISKPRVENAAYSAAVFSHTNFLNTCVACHEVKRPAPVALVAHGGGADCVSCHRPPSWGFSHNPVPVSCVSCHETKRPAISKHLNTSSTVVTSNSHYPSQDCVTCHIPIAGAFPVAWTFTHTPTQSSCIACHEIKRPVAPHAATGDCVSCHSTKTWVTAFNHNPVPTSCVSCHETKRPGTSKHLDVNGATVTTPSHYGVQDCVTCHTPTTGTVLPSAWTFNHAPAQTSCVACHEIKRPVAPHTTTGDCVSCHTTSTWVSTAAFNHSPIPTSCLTCHTKDRPTVNSGHNSKSSGHYSSVQECKSCHIPSPSTWAAGGSKTCILCHLAKGQNQHGSSANSGGSHTNCGNCHSPTKNSW